VHDRGARVLDVVHSMLLGDAPGLRRDHPELEPERTRTRRSRLSRHVSAMFRPPEHVHEVDGLLEL